jgi:hypothetical protein
MPLHLVSHEECQAARSDQRFECPECGKTLLASAIVTYMPPKFSVEFGQYTVERRAYCDHGNLLICWEQATDSIGDRLGEVLGKGKAGSLKKFHVTSNVATIQRFLKAFPQARGIQQREQP